MTVGAAPTGVFDADLPTLAYGEEETPAEVYPRLQAAQRQAPVAMGPHGPEVLSYHLVRSVLRDTRFQIPPGINLLVQGVTSGPLWDKVVNSLLCLEGDAHHRLRSLKLPRPHQFPHPIERQPNGKNKRLANTRAIGSHRLNHAHAQP